MDSSQCVAWLANRSQKVASISTIQTVIYSVKFAYASLIVSDAREFWTWRGGYFNAMSFGPAGLLRFYHWEARRLVVRHFRPLQS